MSERREPSPSSTSARLVFPGCPTPRATRSIFARSAPFAAAKPGLWWMRFTAVSAAADSPTSPLEEAQPPATRLSATRDEEKRRSSEASSDIVGNGWTGGGQDAPYFPRAA